MSCCRESPNGAQGLVAEMVTAGRSEVVADLAVPLPADAIAAVLGLPTDDAAMIHDWIATLFSEPTVDRIDRQQHPDRRSRCRLRRAT